MVTWVAVPGFDGYEVSDTGQVRSWRALRNRATSPSVARQLKTYTDKDGYKKVVLYKDTLPNYKRVATLVAESFLGPRPSYNVVRHIDGSKDNDTKGNLCWGTPKQNSEDSQRHGTWGHGEAINTCKLKPSQVLAIRSDKMPARDLATKYGVSLGTMYHIKRRHTWKSL